MPCGPEGAKINCLWECQTEDAASKFQDFIDNDVATSQASGAAAPSRTTAIDAMPGGSCRRRASPTPSRRSPRPPSGAFFWVLHTFKPDGAAGFWAKVGPALGDPAKFAAMVEGHKAAGFYNHSFIATKAGGSDPMVCIWEAKADCTTEEFQAFIDDNEVAPGDAFLDNAVFKVAPGAQVPSAMFPAGKRPEGRRAPRAGRRSTKAAHARASTKLSAGTGGRRGRRGRLPAVKQAYATHRGRRAAAGPLSVGGAVTRDGDRVSCQRARAAWRAGGRD